jgi:hypothetical protein
VGGGLLPPRTHISSASSCSELSDVFSEADGMMVDGFGPVHGHLDEPGPAGYSVISSPPREAVLSATAIRETGETTSSPSASEGGASTGDPTSLDISDQAFATAQRKALAAAREAEEDDIMANWRPSAEVTMAPEPEPLGRTLGQEQGSLIRMASADGRPSGWAWHALSATPHGSRGRTDGLEVLHYGNGEAAAAVAGGFSPRGSAREKFGVDVPSHLVSKLETLVEMGYGNIRLCVELLTRHDGCLLQTLAQLEEGQLTHGD